MKKILVLTIGVITAILSMGVSVSNAQSYFTVEVKGKGKPMILIHGLYCTGDVWKETVERYQKNYECHILTLSGFGGNKPNLNDHFLESVKDDVVAYVKAQKLKNPILMGHSMGGFLSFWAAASAPGLFSNVIAVDGVPYMSALQKADATPESMKPMAKGARDGMSYATPEQTLATQKQYLPTMISNPERIEQVARIAMKADGKTQGEVLYEMFTTDIRQTVATIDCPVLLLGAWIGYKDYGYSRDAAVKAYGDQVKNIKNATVEISDTAKHFIFYDDPTWFFSKVDAFLK